MPVSIKVHFDSIVSLKADVFVVPVWHDGKIAGKVPESWNRVLKSLMKKRGFRGEWGEAAFFVVHQSRMPEYIAVVGLGKTGDVLDRQVEALRRSCAEVIHDMQRHGLSTLAVVLDGLNAQAELSQAVVEAISLSTYAFIDLSLKLKEKQERRQIKRAILLISKDQEKEIRVAIRQTQKTMQAVDLVRDLVNRPANSISPKVLVEVAMQIAKQSPDISVKIYNRREAEAIGMTAFLAVAQGSVNEPYFIHLKYVPKKINKLERQQRVGLIGKGVTFDSGGLSLKPAEYMEDMKIDMAGAAAVLGVFTYLATTSLLVEVHGFIATCENMPSGAAYRPGDVVKTKEGKTIEVINTDAEGRLTLADAMTFAREQNIDVMIDVATLTGASMVGLGESVAGMWGTNEELSHALLTASNAAGERFALLPMPEEYRSQLDSKVADLRNVATSRYGGAITAAMFLCEFAGDTPWVHLDVAGPAYFSRQIITYWSEGASGFSVRTLIEYLQGLVEKNKSRK